MHISAKNVIVRMQGGLGNQLFQYATGRALACRLDVPLILDLNWYNVKNHVNCKFILDRFKIDNLSFTNSKIKSRTLQSILYKISSKLSCLGLTIPVLSDKTFEFNSKLLTINHPAFLDGYWQNELYFKENRDEFIKSFNIKSDINHANYQLLSQINESNSICIHIRRGDYITDPNAAIVHGICTKDYYYRALKILLHEIESPTCYVFSDEPKWAKANLYLDCKSVFVDINSNDQPELDFFLMKSCKYFVIANSTFSWWAAWLSTYKDKKVIAPKIWFLDNVLNKNMKLPEDWVRI